MKATLHQILYALSNATSNIMLAVDAGDFEYNDEVEITLEDKQLEIQRKGANKFIIHQSTI